MGNIKKTSIKDQAYQAIKDRILQDEYQLGESINITDLCNSFGVSNTPVREALSQLAAEGLVTFRANKQIRVVELNDKLNQEIEFAFFTLYAGAYTTCRFQNRLPALIRLLEQALAVQKKVLETDNYHQFAASAIAFDRCIITATGNEKLLAYHDQLSPLLYLLVRYQHQYAPLNRERNLKEHSAILQAVNAADHDTVLKRLYAHYNKQI